jgi:CRP-like cAMP-binding protein
MVHRRPDDCLACSPALPAALAADARLAAAWQALPRQTYAVGAQLLAVDAWADRAWWIEAGLVRLYYLDANGRERNKSFHAAGAWVAGGVPAQRSRSPYAIAALEATRTVVLPYERLIEWQRELPAVQTIVADALLSVFERMARREAELLMLTAAQRYQRFVAQQPALAARLPLHQIASYLGITSVALSRVRARLRGSSAVSAPSARRRA